MLAAATTPASAERRTAILTVVVNELVAGEQIVYLDEGGEALVPVDVLRTVGLRIHGRTELVDGALCVSLRSMNVRFVVDEPHMVIAITADPTDLPEARIDLAATKAPVGLRAVSATSLYLNYGAHAVGTELDAYAEAGARSGPALLYSSLALLPDQRLVRGLSNLTIDDPSRLRTAVAGDQVVNGGPLGGAAVVGGLHLIRSFELDPYLTTTPAIDLSGTLLAPSTAEIYVDGVLVRREQLAPGRYTLANLPVTSGAGDARVVIRDALGRRHEISTDFYVAGSLLRPGLSDYHVTAGWVRTMGAESFDYGVLATMARYQRGLTSQLTVGLRAQATAEQRGAGASLVAGLPFGQLDLAAGVSSDTGRIGAAASLAWSYASRRGSLTLSGRRVSADYSTLDVSRDADRVVTEGRAQAAFSVGSHVTVGARVSSVAFRDEGWSRRYSLHGTSKPARGATFSLAIERTDDWQQPTGYTAMASLSVGLASRTRASITHRLQDGGRSQIAAHRSLGGDQGIGYRALAEVGAAGNRMAASVQAQSRFGRYEIGYTYAGTEHGTLEASAAGGLALIGGQVFASTPIEKSFALVRIPGSSGVEVSLENHPVGRTDRHGDVFIPRLHPHYGNNISIDPDDLPFDRKLPVTRQIIAPPVGGGAVVVFDAPVLHVVRGTLRVEDGGGSTAPAYGEIAVSRASFRFVSPVSGTGDFELDGVPAGRHPATIQWDGKQCAFELSVPMRTEMIIDLGTVVCR